MQPLPPMRPIVDPVFDDENDEIIGLAFKYSMFVLLGVGALIGLTMFIVAIGRPTSVAVAPPAPPPQVAVREVKSLGLAAGSLPFEDVTEKAGIDFIHVSGATGAKLLPETMGGGVAVLDYDGDGDQDLFFVNSRNWDDADPARRNSATETCALYANDGTGRFHNVTAEAFASADAATSPTPSPAEPATPDGDAAEGSEQAIEAGGAAPAAGTSLPPLYGMGAAVGDLDNDGDPDLYITAVGGNRLYRNDGGRFVDITASAQVGGAAGDWSSSAGWFDYDNDGDLDLWVCRYVVWSREFDAAQDFRLTGDVRGYGRPTAFEGTFPILYRNDRDGRFTDVSQEMGLHVLDPQTNAPLAKSLGVAFADVDQDGWVDVLVSNDTVQNFFFHNIQGERFDEDARQCGSAFDSEGRARAGMGIDVSRFREGVGSLGVAIGNFANEMTALYVNSPEATLSFSDEAVPSGFGPQTRNVLTFAVLFLDADLDGRQDLFCVNGHLEDDIHKVQASQTYAQAPQLFWNAGAAQDTEYVPLDSTQCGPDLFDPVVGRGAAFADLDDDGDLDLVIGVLNGAPRVLMNRQHLNRHWVRFDLRGTRSARDAVGAEITIQSPLGVQNRIVSATRGYQSQVERIATFGLGADTTIDEATIRWPDGSLQKLTGLAVDQLHVVEQSSSSK